jgi:hypothetical protein
MYMHKFRVGISKDQAFPIDMLRSDECYPASGHAVDGMIMAGKCINESGCSIELAHIDSSANWKPTVGRWATFGWRVFDTSKFKL